MYLVLDSSALLSGAMNSIPLGFMKVFITPLIRDEVSMGAPGKFLSNLLEAGLEVRSPVDLESAKEAAESTGDLEELSGTDISVIALALELDDVLVLTDDFRVQNVLSSLNIRFRSAGEIGNRTIREIWEWTWRCRGCGRYFDNEPVPDCPICGSDIRKVRKRS